MSTVSYSFMNKNTYMHFYIKNIYALLYVTSYVLRRKAQRKCIKGYNAYIYMHNL